MASASSSSRCENSLTVKLLVFVGFFWVNVNVLYAPVGKFHNPADKPIDFFGMYFAALAANVFAEEESDGVNGALLDARSATPAIFGVLDVGFFLFVNLDQRAWANVVASPAANANTWINVDAHNSFALLR
jgi:hypothetical protein